MTKQKIFEKYKIVPYKDFKCDNCDNVCEYILSIGPAFKPYDICEYCFLKDTFLLRNVRDLINALRLTPEPLLNETINKLIYFIDKEIK